MSARELDVAAPETRWHVRPFRAGDESAILSLCRTVFGSEMSPEHWRWQFVENPFSAPIVWLAEDREQGIVGHYCIVPVPLWCEGAEELGGYSILSMVHPHFQRQGMLRALAAAAESQLDAQRVLTGATFLNENSYPVYTTQLGWTEIDVGLPVFFTVLDAGEVLTRFLSRWLARPLGFVGEPIRRLVFSSKSVEAHANASKVTIRQAERFDERIDGLWERVRQTSRFATNRNSRYLNWRLVASPREYLIFLAEEGNDLVGAVVIRTDEKFGQRFGYIVDLMFDPKRADIGRLLLRRACDELKQRGCGMVTALALEPQSLRTVLRSRGFYKLPKRLMPHPMHFCTKDRSGRDARKALTSAKNWYVSWSDHDVV